MYIILLYIVICILTKTSNMQLVFVQATDDCIYCLHTHAKAYAICLNQ